MLTVSVTLVAVDVSSESVGEPVLSLTVSRSYDTAVVCPSDIHRTSSASSSEMLTRTTTPSKPDLSLSATSACLTIVPGLVLDDTGSVADGCWDVGVVCWAGRGVSYNCRLTGRLDVVLVGVVPRTTDRTSYILKRLQFQEQKKNKQTVHSAKGECKIS